jgi:hypothetical protein
MGSTSTHRAEIRCPPDYQATVIRTSLVVDGGGL